MNKRWQTAVKFGLFWGLFMAGFSLLFDLQEHSFHEIISSNRFWIRIIGYVIVGIFPVGYFSFRKSEKE